MISPPDPLDEEFPQGDVSPDTEAEVKCPYCGEVVEITLDPGGGRDQEYVEDCQVCCRPWLVRVIYNDSGSAEVEVEANEDVDPEEQERG